MSHNLISKLKHGYLEMQVHHLQIPNFPDKKIIRRKIVFFGKVQGVGFRYQSCLLAKKLGLTGWVKNLSDTVEMEAQGSQPQLDFLVNFMNSRKRIRIEKIDKSVLPLREDEYDFDIFIE